MQPRNKPYIAGSSSDAEAIFSIYSSCFDSPLTLGAVREMLGRANNFAFLNSCNEAGSPGAFIFCRVIGSESELLWLGVTPSMRRRGSAFALMAAAIKEACARRAQAMLLEVAESNEPALALYKKLGFLPVGKRHRYYRIISGEKVDARIMRLPLEVG